MTTTFKKLSLVADKPQQIMGRFSSVRVLEGGFHSIRIYDKDPNTQGDTTRSRRLHQNGILVVGPFVNPWVVAVGQAPSSAAPQLHLECSGLQAAMVETGTDDFLYERNVTNDVGIVVAGSSETYIATNGNDNDGNGVGDSALHHRSVWSGYVRASGAFNIELRVQNAVGTWTTLAAIQSRNMVGYESVLLDCGAWDYLWQRSAPAVFQPYINGTKPALPFGTKCGLVFVDTSGSSNTYDAMISIRSR